VKDKLQTLIPFAGRLRDLPIDPSLDFVLEQPSVTLNFLRTHIAELDELVSRLVWPEVQRDAEIYSDIFRQFSECAAATDREFIEFFSEVIQTELEQTQIFQSLGSEKIILSQAHRLEGSNSQKHVLNVLKKIITDHLPVNDRFLLRVFALMHDNGKMLVAGYDGDTEKLMTEVGRANADGSINCSYISHQILSAMILQSLSDHEADLGKLFSAKDLAYLLCLIEHHHNFGELNKISADPVAFDLDKYFSDIPELALEDRWRYLLHSFLFSLADISATKGHWHYLPENIERFENLVEYYGQQESFDQNFLELCKRSIALSKKKYADIIASCKQK
jgi:hypothetical protein